MDKLTISYILYWFATLGIFVCGMALISMVISVIEHYFGPDKESMLDEFLDNQIEASKLGE
mgnify:CR=1 FL=1